MSQYANLNVNDLVMKLQNAERVIEGQKKMLAAKDRLIQTTTDQYNELLADYQSVLASSYSAQPQQVSSSRVSMPPVTTQESFFDNEPQFPPNNPVNDFSIQSQQHGSSPPPQYSVDQPAPNANDNIPYSKRAMMSSIKFGAEDTYTMPQRTSIALAPAKTAMDDHFNEDPGQVTSWEQVPPLLVDVSGMNVTQMRQKVDELNIEKAEIERQLNKALPKGKIMSHVIKEREDLERQLEDISKAISHVKLEIRKNSNH